MRVFRSTGGGIRYGGNDGQEGVVNPMCLVARA